MKILVDREDKRAGLALKPVYAIGEEWEAVDAIVKGYRTFWLGSNLESIHRSLLASRGAKVIITSFPHRWTPQEMSDFMTFLTLRHAMACLPFEPSSVTAFGRFEVPID
jgi:hypothetical protein